MILEGFQQTGHTNNRLDYDKAPTENIHVTINPIAYSGGILSHTTIVLAATLKPFTVWLPNFVTSCFYLFAPF